MAHSGNEPGHKRSIGQILLHELKTLLIVTAFFFVGFLFIFVLFELMLAQYDVTFTAFSKALLGAVVLAKVVLILQNRRFMSPFDRRSGVASVVYRTTLFTIGAVLVIALERVIDGWREKGALGEGVTYMLETRRLNKMVAVSLCTAALLLGYSIVQELGRDIGAERLRSTFFKRRGGSSPT